MDVLDDLRAAVHRDPKGVAERASRIVREARHAGDAATASRALAVLGRARRSLGEIVLAEADLRAAAAAADALADDELGADARIGLAGVLSFAGRSAEAFALLDDATARGSERLRAYAALQRAIIAQRLGRFDEALAQYEAALPQLREADARTDLALVLMNRGTLRTQTGDCAAAIADLTESGEFFTAEQDDFGVAQTRHGLGWAHARAGNVQQALRFLDDAHDRFDALGHDAPEVDVDRIEVLLEAGLATDAIAVATTVATRLHAAGNHSRAADVWLLCARAALLDGDRSAAAAAAGRSRELFAEQGADAWARAALLEVLRSGGGDPAELLGLARDLDADGNVIAATTALALAAVVAADPALAAECDERASRLGLFEVRMQAAHAVAACAIARGDTAQAADRSADALDDLRRHRAGLVAPDARAAVAMHARALVDLGLQLAVADGSPEQLLAWTERGRAGRAWFAAPRPPDDPDLAADFRELRAVAAALRDPAADRDEALARQAVLERDVQRRLLRTTADGDTDTDTTADGNTTRAARDLATPKALAARLGDTTLIELVAVQGRLLGITVDRTGARRIDIGPSDDLDNAAHAVQSALRAAVRSGPAGLDAVRRTVDALDRWLAPVLGGGGRLVLVVPPELHVVPWQLLPSRRGRSTSVAPSATWWLTVPSGPVPTRRAALVAGPRLEEAEREVLQIAGSYVDPVVLTGGAARTAVVTAALDGADVAHLACHGRIRHDNPLWSSLELVDGPLYVHDLERLHRTPPVVVLSGCDTGVGVRAGDQLLGLSAAFLDHGTQSLIAAVCPLPDTSATRTAMAAVHAGLAAGQQPSDTLAALADEHLLTASCLSCFGTG